MVFRSLLGRMARAGPGAALALLMAAALAALPSLGSVSGPPWQRIALVTNRWAARSARRAVHRQSRGWPGLSTARARDDHGPVLVRSIASMCPLSHTGRFRRCKAAATGGLYVTPQRWMVAGSPATQRACLSASPWRSLKGEPTGPPHTDQDHVLGTMGALAADPRRTPLSSSCVLVEGNHTPKASHTKTGSVANLPF
jgi:hypothetical protein